MTPHALLFWNKEYITPLYSWLELPWRAALLQRLLMDFPQALRYLEVAHREVSWRHSYGALLILINLMFILMMPTEETINSDAYIREQTEFKKCFKSDLTKIQHKSCFSMTMHGQTQVWGLGKPS